MPAVYDLMFLELQQGSPAWDPQRFVPDAIVVALGTNDFSPGDSVRPKMTVAEFAAAYVAFIAQLRADYPNAHIFGVSSPMLGDGWPTPADQSLSDQKAALAQVEAELAAKGDLKVHKFATTKLHGEGCGTHPSVAQDATMAAELADFMRMKLGW
jgi:lysophospholipase L1-like esterase